jgi:hypothetical protein
MQRSQMAGEHQIKGGKYRVQWILEKGRAKNDSTVKIYIYSRRNNINETGNETWGDERQGRPSSFIYFFFFYDIRSSGATAHTHENPRKCWTSHLPTFLKENSQNGRHFSLISWCIHFLWVYFFPKKIKRNDEYTKERRRKKKGVQGRLLAPKLCVKRE